jgi:DNA-directed RNA polymerase specialized sigma24 family protein
MSGPESSRNTGKPAVQSANCDDFQDIFTEHMASLHTLALLLTADEDMAEQCFVAGLQESLNHNLVFRQWAHAWARRAIIWNAVRVMSAEFGREDLTPSRLRPEAQDDGEALINTVIKLPAFERFVFVISVLEGHSASDTATLLGCTSSQLCRARTRALEQMAGFLSEARVYETRSGPDSRWYVGMEIA